MTRIEQWLIDHQITSVRKEGPPTKNSESPYKVMTERRLPWNNSNERERVPINDPDSRGWTFVLTKPAKEPPKDPNKLDPAKKLPMPKTTSIRLQFFTPPGATYSPGVEDMIRELQGQLQLMKERVEDGEANAQMPQPYLGTMLVLHTWLSDDLFNELMDL